MFEEEDYYTDDDHHDTNDDDEDLNENLAINDGKYARRKISKLDDRKKMVAFKAMKDGALFRRMLNLSKKNALRKKRMRRKLASLGQKRSSGINRKSIKRLRV
jgi:hypothetical protein